MKLLLLVSLLLAAARAAFAVDVTSASDSQLVLFGVNAHARAGMTREQLVASLGEPSARLSDQVWAYWDFRPVGQPARVKGDALIVVLAQDRVNVLRLTTRDAVSAALQRLRAAASGATVARR